MLLSIGMMVKNEEKYLEKCLRSLKPLMNSLDSELIIVDTGSEDRTVEIAKRYTQKVYFHKWNNNFSEMRNIVISYAKGEWFFCIDGDEVLEDSKSIIQFFKSGEYKKYNSGILEVKNYTDSKDMSQFGSCDSLRFFRNDNEFKYVGTIHNQPIYKEPTKRICGKLQHYGYISDDIELMEKKFKRTASLLKKELEKDSENIYYRYQLAVSYSMHNDHKDALEEISCAYSKLNDNNKENYTYIFNEYASILLNNAKFKECENLCIKELGFSDEDEVYKIDLLYYLAKSQYVLGDYRNSIHNYNKYLIILKKYNDGMIKTDLASKVLTSANKDIAYNDIAIMEYDNKNYQKVLSNIEKVENKKVYQSLFNIMINSIIKLNNYYELGQIYLNSILTMSKDAIKTFEKELESVKVTIKDKSNNEKVEEIFGDLNIENNYVKLNQYRLSNADKKVELYDLLVNEVKFDDEVNFYGDLLYFSLKEKYKTWELIEKLKYDKIIEFLDYCEKKYSNLNEVLVKFIKDNCNIKSTIQKNKLFVAICRAVLILYAKEDEEVGYIFNKYVDNGIELINKLYSEDILNNKCGMVDLMNHEHEFFVYMMRAKEYKLCDSKLYAKYLKKALKVYPKMNAAIKLEFEKLQESLDKKENEMALLKESLMNNIKMLIEKGDLINAMQLLGEYEQIDPNNVEIFSTKSVILILNGDIEEAENIIKKGLLVNNKNFDLLYNLGYIYELKEKYLEAIEIYENIVISMEECEQRKQIIDCIKRLEEEKVNIAVEKLNK